MNIQRPTCLVFFSFLFIEKKIQSKKCTVVDIDIAIRMEFENVIAHP